MLCIISSGILSKAAKFDELAEPRLSKKKLNVYSANSNKKNCIFTNLLITNRQINKWHANDTDNTVLPSPESYALYK